MRVAAMTVLAVALFGLALMGVATPVEAVVVCGGTIPAGSGTVVLTDDLVCPDNPVLTIVGPGTTLDMDGFKVECDNLLVSTGIILDGTGATLKNGLVQNCDFGVAVRGVGDAKHKVENMVAKDNDYIGFWIHIESNKNELKNSSAVDNVIGFEVDGNSNKLDKCTATGNSYYNFWVFGDSNEIKNSVAAYTPIIPGFVVEGIMNKFSNNTASRNSDGFQIKSGSDLNEFKGNVSSDNEVNGFNNLGNNNKFDGNVAAGNEVNGFRNNASDSNQIQNNTSVGNGGDGIAILSTSSNNTVKGNRVYGNDSGIFVADGAQNNTITENVALGNRTYDLQDSNAGGTCDDNVWMNNIFGTSDPSGVSATCIN